MIRYISYHDISRPLALPPLAPPTVAPPIPPLMTDDTHKVPQSRLARLAHLARAGARTGVSMLKRGDAELDAVRAAAILGQLRGLATKLGQMISYVDGVVPPEHREAYERGMARLQASTPQSSPDEIRALLLSELGRPLEELFDAWEDQPIASASIGQVHRATLHDGRRVAVKVQHPGIADAIEADLSNARLMEMAFAMLGGRKFESKRLLAELRERFREELDYSLEARRQTIFRQIHGDDPEIVIPEVIASHSTSRVLTTTFIEGHPFAWAAEAPPELRRRYAEILWRFVYRANLVGGLFNADPHPGNYLFLEDGRVAFLDFGCVQPIPEDRRLTALTMHRAANQGDMDTFDQHARILLALQGGRYEEMALDYVHASFRTITDSPFHLTRDYSTALIEQFKAMTVELMRGKDDNYVPMAPGVLFINRLQFGFYSVLARLDTVADYRATEQRYLDEANTTGPRFWELETTS